MASRALVIPYIRKHESMEGLNARKKLAHLSGVRVRTLHFYDQIMLLKLAYVGETVTAPMKRAALDASTELRARP